MGTVSCWIDDAKALPIYNLGGGDEVFCKRGASSYGPKFTIFATMDAVIRIACGFPKTKVIVDAKLDENGEEVRFTLSEFYNKYLQNLEGIEHEPLRVG